MGRNMIDTIIKCVLVGIILIGTLTYEIWNQKKNRDAEWYFRDFRNKEQDFRNKVLSFMSELRTEPENTRRMLRKLAFDDLEMKLNAELQEARLAYRHESDKRYDEQKRDVLCNLAGKIDGLNFALERLEASKPKSYQLGDVQTDPSMPKEVQEIYTNSVKQLMDDFDKQLELDKEWSQRNKRQKR